MQKPYIAVANYCAYGTLSARPRTLKPKKRLCYLSVIGCWPVSFGSTLFGRRRLNSCLQE
jgi:hypothetical protein